MADEGKGTWKNSKMINGKWEPHQRKGTHFKPKSLHDSNYYYSNTNNNLGKRGVKGTERKAIVWFRFAWKIFGTC